MEEPVDKNTIKSKKKSNMAKNSLIFGILSFVFFIVIPPLAMYISTGGSDKTAWTGLIVAMVSPLLGTLFAMSLIKSNQKTEEYVANDIPQNNKKSNLAKTGLVFSVLSFIFFIVIPFFAYKAFHNELICVSVPFGILFAFLSTIAGNAEHKRLKEYDKVQKTAKLDDETGAMTQKEATN